MSEGSESIEKILNKVLEGKYTMKEENIDDMFEDEEVNFTFEDTEEGNIEVTKTVIGTQKVIMTPTEVEQLDLFSVDDEFRKSYKKKKKATPVVGQLGFMF